ncbi:MAG TPA: ABC transporter ATP-binding protein/permease [Stellaceae bacterium]|nr:ABC transporter ATP-binding protein/permease [Stellaceae bacterium]
MTPGKRSFLRDAWRLAKPYWTSEDKWSAWGLLIAVIALNLTSVFITVRVNFWSRDFFNAIQEVDWTAFWQQLLVFAGLAAAGIVVSVYLLYLQQMLQIRWRRWLTHRYLDTWLDERAYYRLQLQVSGTDNPDQRISDDLDRFTRQTLALTVGGTGFLNAGVTLISFLGILWSLSGTAAIPLGVLGEIEVPGYMVWFALLYAVGGTWLTFKIGRPLVRLNFDQQRYEADFRFSMMRLRENTESVALYGGEGRERRSFLDRFGSVFGNFRSIMKRTRTLNWYTSGYNQFAVIFPYLVASPRYFAKAITFGDLQQTADAFVQVQTSLSFIINSYAVTSEGSYANIAEWQSVVQRLANFDHRLHEIIAAARAPQLIEMQRADSGVSIGSLDLNLPDGSPLLRNIDLEIAAGTFLLVAGPTGTGKSTLLRAIAGIWPFGRGRIRIGGGKTLFLPQQPYLPLGSLRDALLYPNEDDTVSAELLTTVLRDVGLPALAGDLDTLDNWAHRLSLGEQQRLAFARILLSKPAIIFLDEATSALDEAGEAELYGLLRRAPWHPTVVSVGHRSTLRAFHDRIVELAANGRSELSAAQ